MVKSKIKYIEYSERRTDKVSGERIKRRGNCASSYLSNIIITGLLVHCSQELLVVLSSFHLL